MCWFDWNTISYIFLCISFPCTLRPLHRYRKLNSGEIRIYEGKYGYLRGQITNNDLQLLLNMQRRTYCNKKCDKIDYYSIYILLSIPLPKTFNFWFDYDPCSLCKFEFDNVFKKKILLLQFILYFQFLTKHFKVTIFT